MYSTVYEKFSFTLCTSISKLVLKMFSFEFSRVNKARKKAMHIHYKVNTCDKELIYLDDISCIQECVSCFCFSFSTNCE